MKACRDDKWRSMAPPAPPRATPGDFQAEYIKATPHNSVSFLTTLEGSRCG